MPIFEYKGLARDGKNKRGIIDAENMRAARARLKKDNIFVVDIRDKKKQDPKKSKPNDPKKGKKVGVKDLSLMTRQLATLIKANIPLVDALTAVSEQVENPTLSEALADCKNQVNEGSTLYKAMLKYPNIFTNIYVVMVEAGEMSGSLHTILMRLAEFTEAQADLRAKVGSAMTYPLIMLSVTFALLAFLFIFLIPKMVTVFESQPQLQLPWYTTMIIDASSIMVNYWYIIGRRGCDRLSSIRELEKKPCGFQTMGCDCFKTSSCGSCGSYGGGFSFHSYSFDASHRRCRHAECIGYRTECGRQSCFSGGD